jgi:amino-acid N-acetyltransferase
MKSIAIRPASAADLAAVSRLLTEASLPTAGVAEHFGSFLVAESDGVVIGSMGLELYGHTALLRSAVVQPSWRNSGVGTMLYSALISKAKQQGVRQLLLLTNTAAEYFAKKGFITIDQHTVTGPITQSVEFTGACKHATCMRLDLE